MVRTALTGGYSVKNSAGTLLGGPPDEDEAPRPGLDGVASACPPADRPATPCTVAVTARTMATTTAAAAAGIRNRPGWRKRHRTRGLRAARLLAWIRAQASG